MQRSFFVLPFLLICSFVLFLPSVQAKTHREEHHKTVKVVPSPKAKKPKVQAKAAPSHTKPVKPARSVAPARKTTHPAKKAVRQQKQQPKVIILRHRPQGRRVVSHRRVLRHVHARPLPPPVPAENSAALPTEGMAGEISARSAMVMDADNGATLFAKMPDNPRQPASTIKIVTAMLAIKSLPEDEEIEASRHAASMPSSRIGVVPGRQYSVDDLLNAVLLASANDAAVALGEKIGGTEERFAQLMTVAARMWGAQNTVCQTASGLTAGGQQTTARDLATIFRFAMQNPDFARRVREQYITTSFGKRLRNHNRALWRIDGAVGGKTGYTVAARQTYVGQFTRNGRSIIVSIMGSESMWRDLAKLVEYGFAQQHVEHLSLATP